MSDNIKISSPQPTHVTGDQSSEQSFIRTVTFDRYEIEVALTTSGKFLDIISVRVRKSFIDSMKDISGSDVHDVDEYYREE